MLRVAIVEDNQEQAEQLQSFLKSWADQNIGVHTDIFTEGRLFLQYAQSNEEYQLVFFDIELEDENGLDIAKQFRKNGYKNHIVFATSYRSYSLDGYEAEAIRYMLKPIREEQTHECLDYVLRKCVGSVFTFIYKGCTRSVPFWDILCFESTKHYIDIITSQEQFTIKKPLKEIQTIIPSNFMRCHRSYIINMDYVKYFAGKDVCLTNGKLIPIAAKYMAQFRQALSKHIMV